jgi:hypothetical protein
MYVVTRFSGRRAVVLQPFSGGFVIDKQLFSQCSRALQCIFKFLFKIVNTQIFLFKKVNIQFLCLKGTEAQTQSPLNTASTS